MRRSGGRYIFLNKGDSTVSSRTKQHAKLPTYRKLLRGCMSAVRVKAVETTGWTAVRMSSKQKKILLLLAILLLQASSATPGSVFIGMNSKGLSALRFGAHDFLASGTFRVLNVVFQNDAGADVAGETPQLIRTNRLLHTASATASWGSVDVQYRAVSNQLLLAVNVHNRSTRVLKSFWIELLQLKFPSKPREYDGQTPLLSDSIGRPALVNVEYGTGRLAIAAAHPAQPLEMGLPWATDRPASMIFPLSISTGHVSFFPDSTPTIDAPIPPGQTGRYEISLRFGDMTVPPEKLDHDVYAGFARSAPSTLHWEDRRPIGALFLSTAAAGWPKNPRGWLQDSQIDVTTPEGIQDLRRRILEYADGSIVILKSMNAQGMITWDTEGQEYPHATSYVCDPRIFDTLAPEMQGIADEYFRRFREANLRVGVCIRPQQFEFDGSGAMQTYISDPTDLLIKKVRWARDRWGISIVYIDSNVTFAHLLPLEPAIIKRLSSEFPDILFIPEHATLEYYAYSAPYRELRQGWTGSDPVAREIYPRSFSVIYVADGPLKQRRADVARNVRDGDILLFRAWYQDPQNLLVKDIEKSLR